MYAVHLRARAQDMTRQQLMEASEYHLLSWKIFRAEFNGR